MTSSHSLEHSWQTILTRLTTEVAALPDAERRWLEVQIDRIERLQGRMHDFFLSVGGSELCRDCLGACCARGLHHVTLANLLTFLLRNDPVPQPDFSSTCPLLGPGGCLWPVQRRPFNCVTFLCEVVEERLDEAQREEFYRLEKELRALYLECDRRYAGSSLRGIWIAADRLASRNFLDRR
ncbi:hypothetical protein [Geothermobacter hydrogeniphilus]|uniref:Uncharacterized protein n=1 Tax=Geothermobacter hydrogeniphilus TaxID=1969733 RepID=A0A1X0XQ42_9BACT|nr:hypothetical protein [Geothermobacter hydrogeniphilus]ORJ55031.1 hypothetical protein B5V00_15255 [Geothermobacter hydrogeniphilus]